LYILAEVGSNWVKGSSEATKSTGTYYDAEKAVYLAALTGADGVKFQIGLERLYSKKRAPALYAKMQNYAFRPEWLQKLKDHPGRHKIDLWASIFNVDLVGACAPFLDGLKVASGDLTYQPMVEACAEAACKYKIPLAISTGAATPDEVGKALDWIGNEARVIVLECVSEYPVEAETLNLGWLPVWHDEYHLTEYGLSDHSLSMLPGQLAVAAGYSLIEKHYAPWNNPRSPDRPASFSHDEFREFVHAVRYAEKLCKYRPKEPTVAERSERLWARRGSDGLRPTEEALIVATK
jgi:sialic acid synthase SpsE